MKEGGLGTIFLRHLMMAIPWGIILLIVFFIAMFGIKQQIKEGMQFAARVAVYEASNLVFDPYVVTPIKQNIKEGIEFVAKTTKNEIKDFLNDPQVKKDLKELIEYSGR